MTSKKLRNEQREGALTTLRERLKPGMLISFVCDYRSTRGYSTHGYTILCAMPAEGGYPAYISNITFLVGRATDNWSNRTESVRITGCGFDKRFQIIDHLNHRLGGEYLTKEGALRYQGM